ncbi:MAG TPA: hypothetical protein VF400_10455, partial [Anaeromyxobacteraceae bacterium]
MAPLICSMAAAPSVAEARAVAASALACWALSEDCWVIEAIDSSEEDVSSSAAACSLAPWATDWLLEAICPEAEVT